MTSPVALWRNRSGATGGNGFNDNAAGPSGWIAPSGVATPIRWQTAWAERFSTIVGYDLAHTVAALGSELASKDSVKFCVVVEGERRALPPILQDQVCWIACELLQNAFWHARARHIEAEILYDARLFRLRIRDDGKGIGPNVLEEGAGHRGLPAIKECAKRIGARLDFWSGAGEGTEVELTVPAAVAAATFKVPPSFGLFRRKGTYEQRS